MKRNKTGFRYIILTKGKERVVYTIKKVRKLVYGRYKKDKNILVFINYKDITIDEFSRNSKGYMISQSGYPLFI